jgi:outer membrane protein TolC
MIGPLASAVLAVVPAFTGLSLNDAMSQAVANSAAVAAAQATERQREADLRLARLGGIPHLTGDYSLSPQAAPTGTATVEQHFIAVGVGISVNDILANSTTTRAAAADLLAAQRDADASALRARTTAIVLYFAALQAIAVERVRADAVRGARRELRAAQLRSGAGAAPRIDTVRADVTLAQAQADFARATADRANAVDALASATNVDPSRLTRLGGEAEPRTAPQLEDDRSVPRALALRPEIAALLASIQARDADLALAHHSSWPTATIGGGYERGVDTAIPVQGPQAAVHLDLPIAPGSGERVAIAQAQVDAVRAQLLEQRRTIALDVANAVRTARAAQTAEYAADRARDEAQRGLTAVELGYREGASSSLDVDVARRTYVQASVDALVAEYQRAQALALVEIMVP